MSARDKIHQAVRHALEADGWQITHDPYTIKFGRTNLFIDLAAEKMVVAERNGRQIAVEIKTFGRASIVQDLKDMVGSFQVYRDLLAETAPQYQLHVAISQVTYASDFDLPIAQFLVSKNQIPLIIVDIHSEEIVQWVQP